MDSISELQSQYSSSFDKRKICSYNVEQINEPTKSLMHQESRILFFIKGKGTFKINDVSYKIIPNSCVAIVPWIITEVTEVEEPLQFIKIVYNFNFFNQSIKSVYNSFNDSFDIFNEISEYPIIYCSEQEAKKFIKITNDIKNEVSAESILDIKKEKILSNVFITNKIVELLINFIRIEQKTNILPQNSNNSSFDERTTIFKYLYSHLSEKPTLKSVSTLFFMSESSLSKYCQKITGNTFHDLLNEMRLVKTIDFLLYSEFSLNMIADLVGFNDASHLSKFFTKRIGTTPNQYRKINRNLLNMLSSDERNVTYDLIKYISNVFTEDVTESEVAKEFNMSVAEMNKTLLYVLEKNFYDFINYLRINHACELLKNTNSKIIDIAITVGYNNAKTFNNHFIKLKKMNPSEFRKNVEIQYDYD